jgi:hypothetical protein
MIKHCFFFNEKGEEFVPYLFYVEDIEIKSKLEDVLNTITNRDHEKVIEIMCQPQAVFKLVFYSIFQSNL